ncbi:hypothetical protein GGS21DRAFT_46116 [Xylaria nigripes]|nr:hypothetical protein GGS21DRAFT_46116 [Xylaria nigripes]
MAKQTNVATRALIVALKSPFGGKSTAEIAAITGVSNSQINRIYAKAIERGFDPTRVPVTLDDEWLQNTPGAGRPRKQSDEIRNSSSRGSSAIESCWYWMKKHVSTRKGTPMNRQEATERWEYTWHRELDPAQIQAWIEQKVQDSIDLDGACEHNEDKLGSEPKRPRGRPPKPST